MRSIIATSIVFLCLGFAMGKLFEVYWPTLKQLAFGPQIVYSDSSISLRENIRNKQVQAITWQSLLPAYERELIMKYQPTQAKTVSDLTEQVLRSIEASSDKSYQNAMVSTNTVDHFDGSHVALSGFVVPIEFHVDNTPSLVFLVPYYGACIHFPPPPPNQIVFARLAPGFKNFDITQAYQFEGQLQQGMFEDQLGTSAYTIEVALISIFDGQPDDLWSH